MINGKCSKCGCAKSLHRATQKQSVIYSDHDNTCYPELFHKGNTYIRTCFGIACTCGEKYNE